MKKTLRTAFPWKAETTNDRGNPIPASVVDQKGEKIAVCNVSRSAPECEENAEFIAHACNCHIPLVNAFEELLDELRAGVYTEKTPYLMQPSTGHVNNTTGQPGRIVMNNKDQTFFAVILEDRHFETQIEFWSNKETAVDQARAIAQRNCKFDEDYVEEEFRDIVFHVQYSCEGDSVYVKSIIPDTNTITI